MTRESRAPGFVTENRDGSRSEADVWIPEVVVPETGAATESDPELAPADETEAELEDDSPRAAVAWSGGKDSTLALHRAEASGFRVTHLFNLYEASTGLVRFHGVPRDWIGRQAAALDLRLVQEPVEEDGFEAAFARVLARLAAARVETLVFGNIHLADVREWYESRTRAAGFEHAEPLWGGDPAHLVWEFIEAGYRTIVVSVNLELGDPAWIGRELDEKLLSEIAADGRCDLCGERGEYHSFVVDGPRFAHPLEPVFGGEREIEGHRFVEFT